MAKIICIIQARVGSSRLPNKIFLDLAGRPVLSRVLDRVQKSKLITKVVVAAPDSAANDVIQDFITANHPDVGLFRGSEEDVLSRYLGAAQKYQADVVIRITSDCPLIDPDVIDKVIADFLKAGADYAANVIGRRTYPRGLDVEVFSLATLKKLDQLAKLAEDREHVTLYLFKHPDQFKIVSIVNERDDSKYRLTLDEVADYDLLKKIYDKLNNKVDFRWPEIVEIFNQAPELLDINAAVEQKYANY